ncbi:hypothetical protein NP233_g10021 [Leucocoprinus birnbaumii]|uniref:EamA domain-containing protein n=1 Tax=Leucocoprinus birnbaumii TaxID=56174 RepID=A0AAD5VL32_9AGAR|nr:hypothetical protein NP233_g10021 [Leucocoprinus birnbaumii]
MTSTHAYTALSPDYADLAQPQHGEGMILEEPVSIGSGRWGKLQRVVDVTRDAFRRNVGLLLVVGSQMFFSLMNVAVKKLNTIDPPVSALQLIVVRMSITWICSVTYMLSTGVPDPFKGPKGVRLLLIFRGVSGFFGLIGIYFSLQYLSLSDATVLTFLAPLCTAASGALFLNEKFSRREAFAGLGSLIGVVLIARPPLIFGSSGTEIAKDVSEISTDEATPEQRLIAVGVSLVGVFRVLDTSLRAIGKRAHPLHSLVMFSLYSVIVASIGMIVTKTPFIVPTRLEWLGMLIMIGIFGFFAQILLTMGLARETASRGSMGIYTQIVFATILERIFFHNIPSVLSVIGTLLILSCALYVALTKESIQDSGKESRKDVSLRDLEAESLERGLLDRDDNEGLKGSGVEGSESRNPEPPLVKGYYLLDTGFNGSHTIHTQSRLRSLAIRVMGASLDSLLAVPSFSLMPSTPTYAYTPPSVESERPPPNDNALVAHAHDSGEPDSERTPLQSTKRRGKLQNFVEATQAAYHQNTGLLLVIGSQMFFSLMNLSVKKLNSIDPPVTAPQLIVVRMSITWICSVIYMLLAGVPDPFRGPEGIRLLLVFRGVSGFFGLIGLYISLQYLSLSDATVLTFLAPLCSAISGALLLGEKFSRRQALAGLISLAGVALIARPPFLFGTSRGKMIWSLFATSGGEVTPEQRMIAVGIAMIGVLGTTGAYTSLRAIGKRAHPLHALTMFSFYSVAVASVGMFAVRMPFVVPTQPEWLWMLFMIGIFGFLAQILLTMGLARETVSRGSMGLYTQIVFATILEKLFFDTTPSTLSLVGTLMILCSALYVALTKESLSSSSRAEAIKAVTLRDAEDESLERGFLERSSEDCEHPQVVQPESHAHF